MRTTWNTLAWQTSRAKCINKLPDGLEKEVRCGIFGKVTIYVSRFAAILKALHGASEGRARSAVNAIESEYITMALRNIIC